MNVFRFVLETVSDLFCLHLFTPNFIFPLSLFVTYSLNQGNINVENQFMESLFMLNSKERFLLTMNLSILEFEAYLDF